MPKGAQIDNACHLDRGEGNLDHTEVGRPMAGFLLPEEFLTWQLNVKFLTGACG